MNTNGYTPLITGSTAALIVEIHSPEGWRQGKKDLHPIAKLQPRATWSQPQILRPPSPYVPVAGVPLSSRHPSGQWISTINAALATPAHIEPLLEVLHQLSKVDQSLING